MANLKNRFVREIPVPTREVLITFGAELTNTPDVERIFPRAHLRGGDLWAR